jgi:hypothetical protein
LPFKKQLAPLHIGMEMAEEAYTMGCSGWDKIVVGRWSTLTPPDPQLKGACYPGGFKPSPLNIDPGFKMCL